MVLRDTKDDEGCDIECGYCGRHNIVGRCPHCGAPARKCDGCGDTADKLFWNDGPVFLCIPCADAAFELQQDDTNLS